MYGSIISEEALLKTIVEEELYKYEARFGKAVCHRAMSEFMKKIVKLVILVVVCVICFFTIAKLVFTALGMVFITVGIFLVNNIKGLKSETSFSDILGSMNPIVHYVMTLAKKNPNRKIKDIIYMVCENTAGKQYVTYDSEEYDYNVQQPLVGVTTKEQEKRRRLGMAVLGIAMLCGIVCLVGYHVIPHASYVDVDTGYMVQSYRVGFSMEGKAVIPDTYNGKPVVAINSGAFKGDWFLKTVELPNTIKSIGGEAFMNCKRLESINIPDGVLELRGNTFEGCSSLEQVVVPDSVVEIHGECFVNCKKLQFITLSANITEIKGSTFQGCSSLQSIDIPQGVTRIAGHAFEDCYCLSVVNVPLTVQSIGSSAFRSCDSLYEIYLPPNVSIDERAFKESPTTINYLNSPNRG